MDLSAYADELERQGEGKRALQLDSIVEEIRYPYRYGESIYIYMIPVESTAMPVLVENTGVSYLITVWKNVHHPPLAYSVILTKPINK